MWRGEIQARALGMRVDVFDDDGRSPVRGEKGELVCTMPFPSMPVGFWNDPDGRKYRAAYFDKFPGVWRHGDYVELTEHDGMIIYGRSDAVLNPGGVRIGTAEIYRQVEQLDEVVESLVIGQRVGRRRADRPLRPAARRARAAPTRCAIASGSRSAEHDATSRARANRRRCRTSRGRRAARSSSSPCATSFTAARSRTAKRSPTPKRWNTSATARSCGMIARILEVVLATIGAQALRESPNECCGLLLGTKDLIDEAVPTRNVLAHPSRYQIDPEAHIEINRRLRGTTRSVIGAYHSHPRTERSRHPRRCRGALS